MEQINPSEIDETHVRYYFGDANSTRGDIYERGGAVLSLAFDEPTQLLKATVRGSIDVPYKTEVQLGTSMHGITDVRCNCPLVGFCKHSAAVVFHAVRTGVVGKR